MTRPSPAVPRHSDLSDLRLLLVGSRRMPALAESLKPIAPRAEFVVVGSAAEGEPHLDDVDIVIMADRLTKRYLASGRLRWLHLYPTGIDHVAIPGLRDAPFVVTHKVQASVIPMAEHIMALLLAIARRLPDFRDLQTRKEWRHFSGPPATTLLQLRGQTLGIVGLGAVGQAVARRARAFGMRVLATKRDCTRRLPHVQSLFPPAQLHDVLGQSDFVVLLTPLTDATHHLIGEPELRAMKPTAHLINVSRGPVIDEAALVRALQTGQIAGAALDVFEEEPLHPANPLWDLPNTIVTPHVAGSGPDNERDASAEIAQNLRRFLRGQPLSGQLNRADILTQIEAPTH